MQTYVYIYIYIYIYIYVDLKSSIEKNDNHTQMMQKYIFDAPLTHQVSKLLSYRNQSIDLLWK